MIFLTLLTIIFGSITFLTITFRENQRLIVENAQLRKSRQILLSLVKDKTQTISDYDTIPPSSTDSLSAATPYDTIIQPHAGHHHNKNIIKTIFRLRSGNDIPYCFMNGLRSAKVVALTFDGGSLVNAAPAILDTLQSRSIKATMFLTGEFIRKFPEITRRIYREGHECGNHTYSHPHLTTYAINRTQQTLPLVNAPTIGHQLAAADALFFSVTGSHFHAFWRAPYGEFNREICQWGYAAGYLHIGWRQGRSWLESLDSNDWIPDSTIPGYRSPEDFLKKIVFLTATERDGINGGIILMHLGTQRIKPETQTHLLLGKIIDTLLSSNITIVPISRMITLAGLQEPAAELRGLRNEIW